MSMIAVEFNVPQEILLDLKISEKAFTNYAKRFLALDLYKTKSISLGYCTELAGMSEEDFIKFLGENRVSIFDFEDEDEFLEEINNA